MKMLMVFLYIFAFEIPIVNDSAKFVGLILIVNYLVSSEYRKRVNVIIFSKKSLIIIMSWALVVSWFLLTQLIHLTYQFTFLKTYINLLIQIIIGLFIVSLYSNENLEELLIKDLVLCFILQTVIQWISFINPNVRELLNVFKSSDAIRIGQKYNNMRALALSGSQFFGLSATYGLIYMIYVDKMSYFSKKGIITYLLIFLLLISGTFFAGRTGYIGLFLAILIYCFSKLLKKKSKSESRMYKKGSYFFQIPLVIILLFITLRYFFANINYTNLTYLMMYTFEMFINLKNKGSFYTTSTEGLLNNMYFPVSIKTFLIGDGKYIDLLTNRYYMNTDAGYMRNILLFGVIGFILLFVFQLTIINLRCRKFTLFDLFVIAYLFILHIKGETIGFLIIFQSVLLLYYLSAFRHVTTDNEIQ
jgi:hypothetical protein